MKMPFDFTAIPLSYVEEGLVPLANDQKCPLRLLTDGNITAETLAKYRFCFGRNDVELHHISTRPELAKAYIWVTGNLKVLLHWHTTDAEVDLVNTIACVEQLEQGLSKEFPEF